MLPLKASVGSLEWLLLERDFLEQELWLQLQKSLYLECSQIGNKGGWLSQGQTVRLSEKELLSCQFPAPGNQV
jgi:hypothetical protein